MRMKRNNKLKVYDSPTYFCVVNARPSNIPSNRSRKFDSRKFEVKNTSRVVPEMRFYDSRFTQNDIYFFSALILAILFSLFQEKKTGV